MIWRDGTYNMVAFQEGLKYGETAGVDFRPRRHRQICEAFGATGFAVRSAEEFLPTLRRAMETPGPVLIDIPVDYSHNADLGRAMHQGRHRLNGGARTRQRRPDHADPDLRDFPIAVDRAPTQIPGDGGKSLPSLLPRPRRQPSGRARTLFQVSTSGAIVEGVFGGVVSVGTLREHGDFGLGTFVDLDGEMIVLDGEVYQMRSDGTIRIPRRSRAGSVRDRHPASPRTRRCRWPPSPRSRPSPRISTRGGTDNLFFAALIRGRFSRLHVRIACKADEHETLVEATSHQAEFSYTDIDGTLLGFWRPLSPRASAFRAGISTSSATTASTAATCSIAPATG